MVTFGERIRALANALGKEEQEIATDLGLTKSRLSHYINGRSKVPSDLLQMIVDIYKINPQYLFEENAPLYKEKKKEKAFDYHYFPTAISAGLPINVDGITNDQVEKISLPDSVMGKWAGKQDIFITKINGDSMDKIMPHGSLIAVKPVTLDELKDGDMVVFSDNYDYSVKCFYQDGDRLIFKPESYNKKHADQIYSVNDNIEIHGKVILYIVERD